jgi:hypothetical protein
VVKSKRFLEQQKIVWELGMKNNVDKITLAAEGQKEFLKFSGGLTEEELVEKVSREFLRRQSERRQYELQWRLNMNFVMGNQYSSVN